MRGGRYWSLWFSIELNLYRFLYDFKDWRELGTWKSLYRIENQLLLFIAYTTLPLGISRLLSLSLLLFLFVSPSRLLFLSRSLLVSRACAEDAFCLCYQWLNPARGTRPPEAIYVHKSSCSECRGLCATTCDYARVLSVTTIRALFLFSFYSIPSALSSTTGYY